MFFAKMASKKTKLIKNSSRTIKKFKVFLGSARETAYAMHEFIKQAKSHKLLRTHHTKFPNLWEPTDGDEKPLDDFVEFIPWDEPTTWNSGKATIDDVIAASKQSHLAIFFLGHEDVILTRQQVQKLTRPNIWLEIGIFIGALGTEKTVLLDSAGYPWGEGHIPTDLSGITRRGYIGGKGFAFEAGINEVVKAALHDVNMWNDPNGAQISDRVVAHVLLGRENCYRAGISLVNAARHALYSILSFPEEATGPDQPKMREALQGAIKRKGLSAMKRWIDLGNKDFHGEAQALVKTAKKRGKWKFGSATNFQIIQTQCQYVEAIISDDAVLLVFPDYEAGKSVNADDQVGLGLQVGHAGLAVRLKEWCEELVGAKLPIEKGKKRQPFPPNTHPALKLTTKRSKAPKTSQKPRRSGKRRHR
jgi:predicted nucleotide-binding protein with TIR-like domain